MRNGHNDLDNRINLVFQLDNHCYQKKIKTNACLNIIRIITYNFPCFPLTALPSIIDKTLPNLFPYKIATFK